MISLGELAVRFGCELRGDPGLEVGAVAALGEAGPGTLSFLGNPRYRADLAGTRATAVILPEEAADECPVPALLTGNPHAVFARIASLLHPLPALPAGIHPSAIVAADASIDPTAYIGPQAIVGARVRIGPRAAIGPACIVEEDAVIAEDVRLLARVTVCRRVEIGARTLVKPGAVIGADGFGFAKEGAAWLRVPQVGAVKIGCDVEIGANTTIDCGAIGDTVIGNGVKLDNQIQIAHNVRVGEHTAMAACVGISGSSSIGARCMLAGAVGVAGHLDICDDVTVTGYSLVSHSITQPGVYSGGIPAEDAAQWRRLVGRLKRLDHMARRLAALERGEGAATDRMGESADD